MMKTSLRGKVAIVTGAGGAIGRAAALEIARQGARVMVNDLGAENSGSGSNPGPAHKVAEEIRAMGGEAVASTQSIADWTNAQQIVADAIQNFGRVDILVNNAGNIRFATFQDSTPEMLQSLLDVHLHGSYFMARALAPHFIERKGGVYIHMTSSTALIGHTGNACYTMAKMGVVALSRAIALDMAGFNVRSNCISPAATSRMSPKRANAEVEALYASKARPEQVAPLVAYLASDAAEGITGQIIGARGNELYLYSQPRPIRTLHRDGGWDVEAIANQMKAAWQKSFTPLEDTGQVFAWPPQ